MNQLIRRFDRAVSSRTLNLMDSIIDRRICGLSLVPYVPSIFRNDKTGEGGTGTQSTHYVFLRQMFSDFVLRENDVFLDVGCGKGRILAYLIQAKCPCPLYGVEYNEEVGKIAQDWSKQYEQISILIGDALTLDYNPYTALSLARPFLQKNFRLFVEHLEQNLTHPIRIIFSYGQEYYFKLDGRPGWEMQLVHPVLRWRGVKHRHFYSIWSFDPGKRREENPES